MIQAPGSMNEFMDQANKFVAKAKNDGIDDNRIANTIRFMYGLTQQNISNNQKNTADTAITPYQQAQLDLEKQGTWSYNADGTMYNTRSGEVKNMGGTGSDVDSYLTDVLGSSKTQTNAAPKVSSGFDFDSAANTFSFSNPSTQPTTTGATPQATTPKMSSTNSSMATTSSIPWKQDDSFMKTLQSIGSGTYGTPWSK